MHTIVTFGKVRYRAEMIDGMMVYTYLPMYNRRKRKQFLRRRK